MTFTPEGLAPERDPGEARYVELFGAWYDAKNNVIRDDHHQNERLSRSIDELNKAREACADFFTERAKTMGGEAFDSLRTCEGIPRERRGQIPNLIEDVLWCLLERMKSA